MQLLLFLNCQYICNTYLYFNLFIKKFYNTQPIIHYLYLRTMKKTSPIILSLAALGAAAVVIYITKRITDNRMLIKVADEGYETAHDILYPNKYNNDKGLRYGPVLPM